MANVLNRTTKLFLKSVNTPDYPTVDWIINPDMSNVVGISSKYWKITGDTVTEMTSEEKATVDADLTTAQRATIPTVIQLQRNSDDTIWNIQIDDNGQLSSSSG